MADIFIYSALPLGYPRGELEDDLDDLLSSAGEVTGAGAGEHGWNVDVEIFNEHELSEWIFKIIHFLKQRLVPVDTYLDVYQVTDGVEYRTTHRVYGAEAS